MQHSYMLIFFFFYSILLMEVDSNSVYLIIDFFAAINIIFTIYFVEEELSDDQFAPFRIFCDGPFKRHYLSISSS